MLYLVGLGLFDEQDISWKGLETIRKCQEIYAELYTSPFSGNLSNLERAINKKILLLQRSDLEEAITLLLKKAQQRDVALLVPGDPLIATTHLGIILKAEKLGIKTKVIHSSSIFSGIAETGLQIYKFGRTTSLPFPEKGYFPLTPLKILKKNLELGLHTLFLLDVREEEKRFMKIPEGIEILLEMKEKAKEKKALFTPETFCLGLSRLGSPQTKIKFGRARELMKIDFGKPPHTLIIPGKLHFLEEEALERFR